MSVLHDFDEWKQFLADRIKQAQSLGMDEETIKGLAHHVGDYLNEEVDPKNHQQRVLKELWDVADEQEQQTLANLMYKMVQQ